MAFPTTPVLDTFTRADENPLTGIWLGELTPGESQLQLLSNRAAGVNPDPLFNGSYTTPVGADCEAYATIPVDDAGNRCEVYARVFIDVGGLDAYCVSRVGSTWSIRKKTNSGDAAVGATATQAFSAGDSLGIACYGSTIEGWYKPAAGAWTLVLSRTDTTWTNAGYIGLRLFGTVYRADDFGGGTIASTGVVREQRIRSSRSGAW